MPHPLEGIKVLEVTTALIGPMAGVYLADMGADVVRLEPPEGDLTRMYRGAGNGLPPEVPSPMFLVAGRGKKSAVLDLSSDAGREACLRLAAAADVFLTNFRGDALAEWGLGYQQLRSGNPRLVYASASGFGSRGPDAGKGMVDGAGQARGGICNVTGYPEGPGLLVGAMVADAAGAMQLCLAVMTALVACERHGVGQHVEVSALGAQLWLQTWEITHTSLTGHQLEREGPHHPNLAGMYGTYQTADGRALFLAFARSDECWKAFCAFAGMPELGTNPRWDTFLKRTAVGASWDEAAALRPHVVEAVKQRTLAEWTSFLEGQPDIVWSTVQTYGEVLEDPQTHANGYVEDVDLPVIGPRRLVGNFVQLSETPGNIKGTIPELGEHTEEVLADIGYGAEEIAAIQAHNKEAVAERLQRLM